MTTVQIFAVATPAIVGIALMGMTYFVHRQNRAPALSSKGAATEPQRSSSSAT